MTGPNARTEPLLISGWADPKFARTPEELLIDADVTDASVRLYGRLMLYLDYSVVAGEVFPGYATLAASLGWSEAKLVRNMKGLISAGWAHRRRRPGTSSLTFLCAHKGQRPTWPELPQAGEKGGDEQSEQVKSDLVNKSKMRSPNRSDQTAKQEPVTENQTPATAAPAPPSPAKPPGKWSDAARAIADTAWEGWRDQSRVPTASSWKGVATVAQQLLDVGHQPNLIAAAILAAPVCTFNAVTITLGARDAEDGSERRPATTVPAAPPAPKCPTCEGHPGWMPDDPDDDESTQHPCPTCRPELYARWRPPAPDPTAAPTATQGRLPRRADIDK